MTLGKRAAAITATAFAVFAFSATVASAAEINDDAGRVSVTVPTRIECTMLADGTVMAPHNLPITNNGPEVTMEMFTANDLGNHVDYNVEVDGSRALERTDGSDRGADPVRFAQGSDHGMELEVSPMTRAENGALMDRAAAGTADLFALGYRFTPKPVQEVFAVYSDDDKSLTLYNRIGKPEPGEQFDGKTATAVYDGSSFMNGGQPWADVAGAVLNVAAVDSGIAPTSTSSWFYGFRNAGSIDVSKCDFGKTTDMSFMFAACNKLQSLDVSGFDTSSVTDMEQMFDCCFSLSELDVSGFDTSQVTDMGWMFYDCSGLTALDVTGFDTSKVTDMDGMFQKCSNLSTLDVHGFDTSKVTDMGGMFAECGSLQTLDVSGFDTSKVTKMTQMFEGCHSLTVLDISGFDMSNIATSDNMIDGCYGLTSITVGSTFKNTSSSQDDAIFPRGQWRGASDGAVHDCWAIPSDVADTYTIASGYALDEGLVGGAIHDDEAAPEAHDGQATAPEAHGNQATAPAPETFDGPITATAPNDGEIAAPALPEERDDGGFIEDGDPAKAKIR